MTLSLSPKRARHELFFPYASQPDIVRSSQKDEFYRKQHNEQCFEVASRVFGPRAALKFQKEINLFAELSYFIPTTVIGQETLGEEYCDLVKVCSPNQRLPEWKTRLFLILTHCLLPYTFEKALNRLSLTGRTLEEERREFSLFSIDRVKLLSKNVPLIKVIANTLQRMHLALFYFTGKFYDFSKRLFGIRYISNKKPDSRSPLNYGILGVLIFIQLIVNIFMSIKNEITKRIEYRRAQSRKALKLTSEGPLDQSEQSDPDENETLFQSSSKCSLCLGSMNYVTATSCGHLFCWNCITEWINNKAECPLCRQPITPQSLVCIYYF